MSHYPFYEKRNQIILSASWDFSFNRNPKEAAGVITQGFKKYLK